MKNRDQGIVLDEKNQEQPKDKARARGVNKIEPEHMPPRQPVEEDDELQPLREKSGF